MAEEHLYLSLCGDRRATLAATLAAAVGLFRERYGCDPLEVCIPADGPESTQFLDWDGVPVRQVPYLHYRSGTGSGGYYLVSVGPVSAAGVPA